MQLNFEIGAFLLLGTAALSMMLRRFSLPYTAGLAAASIGLALLPLSPRIAFSEEIYAGLIPPLVFTAAYSLDWRRVRRELALILSLGIGGIAVSMIIAALALHYVARWGWLSALMLASIMGAADAVSVPVLFCNAKPLKRLRLLISADSLISNGFAAIAVGTVLTFSPTDKIIFVETSITLLTAIGGAVLCGAAVAGIALFGIGRTSDSLVQIAVTTAAAWVSFFTAERLHFSGVLATIVAGGILGSWLRTARISDREQDPVSAFWDVAALLSSCLVFLLVGIHELHLQSGSVWFAGLVAVLMMLVGRACAVYSLSPLFARSPGPLSNREQPILTWYGLRGALPLALALCIPVHVGVRTEIISACLIAVVFSVFVEGFTIPYMLRRQSKEVTTESLTAGGHRFCRQDIHTEFRP